MIACYYLKFDAWTVQCTYVNLSSTETVLFNLYPLSLSNPRDMISSKVQPGGRSTLKIAIVINYLGSHVACCYLQFSVLTLHRVSTSSMKTVLLNPYALNSLSQGYDLIKHSMEDLSSTIFITGHNKTCIISYKA